MSLVNEMLRDLDSRHAPQPGDALRPGEVVRAPLAGERSGTGWILGLFVAGVLTASAAAGSWVLLGSPGADTAPGVAAGQATMSAATSVAGPEPATAADRPQQVAAASAAEPRMAPQRTPPQQPETARHAEPSPAQARAQVARVPESQERAVTAAPVATAVPAPLQRQPHVPTLAERDRNTRAAAMAALQRGDVAFAEATLRGLLAESPAAPRCRELLISLLLQQGRMGAAESVLGEGLALEPGRPAYAKLLARIKIALGDAAAALAALDGHAGVLADDPEYLGLQAVARQRLGEHAQAVQIYRVLLERHRPQATWWLGLAISLEATGAADDARTAYQRVTRMEEAQSGLRQFASRRLAALGHAGG